VQNLQDLLNWELFLNGKTYGLGPRCRGPAAQSGPWWTEGDADTRHGGASPARGVLVAARLRSSPAKAGEEDGDEAVPVRGSPDLGRRQSGGMTVVEHGSGKLHVAQVLEWERVL
jgi:hypothetical protein